MCTRTQEKGALTPQETEPDFPGSVQESLAEVWVSGGLLQGSGHAEEHAWDLLKKIAIICITSTILWPQVKQQRRNIALPFNRKLD